MSLQYGGLNIFQRIAALFGRDYVVLRMHDKRHRVRRVSWLCERPFAAPYLPETNCQLLPFGSLIGPCYVESWLPVTPKTQQWCGEKTTHENS